MTASAPGLTDYDAGMDDVSAEGFAERERDARDFLDRFSAIGDEADRRRAHRPRPRHRVARAGSR
ncbi:MAG: hypothetical protein U0667_00640 [Chloroflexota bacterium]